MISAISTFSFPPVFLVLHCLCIFLFRRWLGPIGTFYGSVFIFFTVLFLSLNELYFITLTGTYSFVDFGRWFFCLDLIDSHMVFCLDILALVSSSLVLLLTMFALYFGVEYMYREAFVNRLLYLLNLFATSVVFLFYCYDFFLILFAWECIGLFSFLLVNFYSTRIYTIKAALKTFVFSRVSDMFMFFTFILSINVFMSTELSIIFLQAPFMLFHYLFLGNVALHFLTLFSLSLTISGTIKAAQFFSHVWLPDAMEAPTPASALIHSSTLVVAGIFLVIRFSILFEFAVLTNYYLAILGAVTLAFGAVTATFQNDIKKLVAYSTISQIGYLVCGCGFCCYEEVLVYLIVHALNKAFLFVLVGYLVHFFSGNTDMRQMGGAYTYSFDVAALLFGVCFNLTGLPYSAGFLGKEFLLFQVLRDDFVSIAVRACWLVSFFFTPVYMFILTFVVVFNTKRGAVSVYRAGWYSLLLSQASSLRSGMLMSHSVAQGSAHRTQDAASRRQYFRVLTRLLVYRFHFTLITSRTTSYLLFLFWVFFFFFGESLLLLTFNFTTPVDTISSVSFFSLKQHVIFMTNSLSSFLVGSINFYIYFLTTSAFLYLVNLGYMSTYRYHGSNLSTSLLMLTLLLFWLF